MSQRSNFSSKIGFVLAAAGSAVGLGNLWRFPYLAAKYGGGTFLLVYLILAVTFGFSLMIAEIAIGRKTGLSAIGAFKKLDKRFGFLGVLAAIIPIIILPYYSVIGGWVIKYFVTFATGNMQAAADDAYFSTFTSSTGEPIGWFCLFIAFTSIIVLLGVEKGIETVSKFMMPCISCFNCYYCRIRSYSRRSNRRFDLLYQAKYGTLLRNDRHSSNGAIVLFDVSRNGNYDYIRFLYEKR